MVAIPAAKLFFLAVRQFSKPLGAAMKSYAMSHPLFKRTVVGFAQKWHVMDMRIKTSLLGHKKVDVRPLSEAKAIESASEVVSELTIYAVASSMLIVEYMRSSAESRHKELQMRTAMNTMASKLESLEHDLEQIKWKADQYDLVLSRSGLTKHLGKFGLRHPESGSEPPESLMRFPTAAGPSVFARMYAYFAGSSPVKEDGEDV